MRVWTSAAFGSPASPRSFKLRCKCDIKNTDSFIFFFFPISIIGVDKCCRSCTGAPQGAAACSRIAKSCQHFTHFKNRQKTTAASVPVSSQLQAAGESIRRNKTLGADKIRSLKVALFLEHVGSGSVSQARPLKKACLFSLKA